MRSIWHDSNKIILMVVMGLLLLILGVIIFLPLIEILQKSFYAMREVLFFWTILSLICVSQGRFR